MPQDTTDPPTPTSACRKRKRKGEASKESGAETNRSSFKIVRHQRQPKSNGRFSGEIFTIIVGDEVRFTVHENVLSESPVFKAMCTGPFQESTTRTIELLDDDALAFEILLEIFYRDCTSTEVLSQICADIIPADGDHPSTLAGLYTMADRYQLLRLQHVIVGVLRNLDLPTNEPLSFLTVAQTIYENLASPQGSFPDYFRSEVRIALRDSNGIVMDKAHDIIEGGGALAVDIYRAMAISCTLERERTEACVKELEYERQFAMVEKDRVMKKAADEKSKVERAATKEKSTLERQWEEEKAELVGLLSLATTNSVEFKGALRKKALASISA